MLTNECMQAFAAGRPNEWQMSDDNGYRSAVGENDSHSFETAGLTSLQLTLWISVLRRTCRIIKWSTRLVGSDMGTAGCTWVTVRAVIGAAVQSTLDVFLVFCVLVEWARFGRQQGHIMTERLQRSAVIRGCCLTELLCHLCNVQRRKKAFKQGAVTTLIRQTTRCSFTDQSNLNIGEWKKDSTDC